MPSRIRSASCSDAWSGSRSAMTAGRARARSRRPWPTRCGSRGRRSVQAETMQALSRLLSNIERVIRGKRAVVETVVAALLARGHVLIEDVPGLGKTMLARAVARSIDADYRRVQCT